MKQIKKTIRNLLFIIPFLSSLSSFAQYEMYDMMYQMEMQKAFNKVESHYSYKCFGGESVTCFIVLARMRGFSDVTATIESQDQTKSKELKVECLIPMSVTIQAGSAEWPLAYGDKISVYYDNGSLKTLTVGIDDGMSEVDWNRWSAELIASANPDISPSINSTPIFNNINIPTNINSVRTSQPMKCQCCSGTGISSTASQVAAFGNTEEHWCSHCQMYVSASHGPHLTCKCCNGTGFLK